MSTINTPRESTMQRIATALEGIEKKSSGGGSVGSSFKYSVIVDNGADGTADAVEYADDCVGFIPAIGSSMNDWDGLVKNYFRPCVIQPGASQPAYYLQHDNMTEKEDGSNAVLTGADGDVMVEVKKLYISFTKISNTSFKASLMNYREKSTDICVTKFGNTEYEFAYRGAYVGGAYGSDTNKMRSVSGVAPMANMIRSTARTRAKNVGNDYFQNPFQLLLLWQVMFLLLYKTRNSQAAIGNGYVGASAAVNTGGLNSQPFTYGVTSDSKHQMKFLGCEDFYGNVWEWVDGVVLNNGTYKTTFDDSKYNDTGDGFENSEASGLTNATDGGKYIKTVAGDNACGFLPKVTGAGSTTFFCDVTWVSDAVQVFAFGGSCNNGSNAGAFCSYLNSGASIASAYIGSRLCRK